MTNVLLTRATGAGVEDLAAYRAAGGYEALARVRSSMKPDDVIREVADAELRGHGGAAFPAGRKWALAAAAEGAPKYVVANGGEHEPGSRKDRLLLAQFPHKVLEGTALCAYATGATVAYVYVIEDMADAIASVRRAIEESKAAGLLGDLEVHVALAPPTYVAGEETAALEVIEGRKAWPRKKPPYPGQVGLFGKPTTVNNVETLAYVPAIVRDGAARFRALGKNGGAGRKLFTLDERVRRPGVHELPLGATFRELIDGAGGGARSGRAIRAILPAMSSAFLPGSALDVPMTFDAVKEAGSGLGCGGVSFVEEGEPIVDRLVEISRFFMREQCGQCPPCRM
ncbi:MAG TPA: SLBB domain-containing protein, partial [Planctomycetota bacterium]|nr:SLBB domain-containing protein [Planctomycetota bacterium]